MAYARKDLEANIILDIATLTGAQVSSSSVLGKKILILRGVFILFNFLQCLFYLLYYVFAYF